MTTLELMYFGIGFLLMAVFLTLQRISSQMRRYNSHRIASNINQAIEHLGEATRHYTEVNAILALTEQFEDRPELAEKLSEFSRQTVAAALMVRINGVASDIKMTQDKLSEYRRHVSQGSKRYQKRVVRNEQTLKHLQDELDMLGDIQRHRAALDASAIN